MLEQFRFDNPVFPDPNTATKEGLLAVGGSLSPDWLLEAYSKGIFPWFSEGDPILWWSPDPRSVIFLPHNRMPKSMRPYFNQKKFELKIDYAFEEVIELCSQVPRKGQDGTWITEEMKQAYIKLHHLGYAHSFEAWKDGKLAGGLYGIGMNGYFCGESMFALEKNASKFAFFAMIKILSGNGFELLDCQIQNPHLQMLGCKEIPRKEFLEKIEHLNNNKKIITGNWSEKLIRTV